MSSDNREEVMPSNSELDEIVADICCTPDECTPNRLCAHCVKDKQRLLAWRDRAVEEALADLATEFLEADKVDDSACYVDRKRLKKLRAAHSSRKET